jgi:predicted DNA-binding protein YlxM (UPF0122 family)
MSKITIVEAARQFNVTRPRIYRAIQKGELTTTLSDEGVQLVQTQDMIRLFEHKKRKSVTKQETVTVSDTNNKMILLLEEQLRKAEEDKAFLKEQIQGIRKDFDAYKLRIEYQEQVQSRTDITGNDHVQTDETLQKKQDNEQVQRTVIIQPEPSKKIIGFLSKLLKLQ